MGCWTNWLLFLLALPLNLLATGPVVITDPGRGYNLVPHATAIELPQAVPAKEALLAFTTQQNKVGSTAFGFSKNYHWLRVPLRQHTRTGQRMVLEIDNPHIDRAEAWLISDSITYLGISGDRMLFWQRTIHNRRPVFEFEMRAGQCAELLVMVDKRDAAVTVPMRTYTLPTFAELEIRQSVFYGLYFGVLGIVMLYSVLIYALQRKPVYLWYGLSIFLMLLYLMVSVGFGCQFLYPWSDSINNVARLVLVPLVLSAQLRFLQAFLQLRSLLAWAYRGFNAIIIINMLLVVLSLFAGFLFKGKVILAINALYLVMGLSFLLTVVALVLTYRAQRSSVVFFALAFSTNLLAYLVVVLEEYGILDLSNWPLSPFFIGLFFEMVIFSIALSYRSRLISDDRSRLLGSIQVLKRDAMNAFVEGVEVEKKRVATELHDDVAATLSLLKRTAERGVASTLLAAELATVTERVRQLSYNLNPVALDEESFLEQLRKLVDEHRQNGTNIVLQVFDVRAEIPKELGLELYRVVQEALQNIQKYAEAKQVDVQLFQHEEELLLTIEDNGKGFDPELARSGLGTRNMRLRTERLGGTFDISSAPMKGTSIMVSVPFLAGS